MPEWRAMTLGDICTEAGGGVQTGPFGSQLHAADYVADGTPSVMPQNIGDNRIDPHGISRVALADMERLERYRLKAGDIVYSRRGDVERRALVRRENEGWLCGTGCLRVRIGDQSVHDSRFVSYALGANESRHWIVRHAVGATMLNLNTSILSSVPLMVPKLVTQRSIADLLEAFDDKVEANSRTSTLAHQLISAKFEATIQSGSDLVRVADMAIFHNRFRVPLSSRDRELRRGSIPYYGAAGVLDYVDSALFDEPLVLVGEDGSVVRDDGRPVIQYVWGKSWVNNHAHVLTGRTVSTELLRVAIERTSVAHLVTGAVQPKISMGKLGSLDVAVPKVADDLERQIRDLTAVTRSLIDENRLMAATRDQLLQLLMSGQVRVRDAERQAEDVL